jgi:hypothetical protein
VTNTLRRRRGLTEQAAATAIDEACRRLRLPTLRAVMVLTEREEKASIAIGSNETFSGWRKTFTDPRLCAAIVDRLTFHGTIIETGTDSYRLAHTKQEAPG